MSEIDEIIDVLDTFANGDFGTVQVSHSAGKYHAAQLKARKLIEKLKETQMSGLEPAYELPDGKHYSKDGTVWVEICNKSKSWSFGSAKAVTALDSHKKQVEIFRRIRRPIPELMGN